MLHAPNFHLPLKHILSLPLELNQLFCKNCHGHYEWLTVTVMLLPYNFLRKNQNSCKNQNYLYLHFHDIPIHDTLFPNFHCLILFSVLFHLLHEQNIHLLHKYQHDHNMMLRNFCKDLLHTFQKTNLHLSEYYRTKLTEYENFHNYKHNMY